MHFLWEKQYAYNTMIDCDIHYAVYVLALFICNGYEINYFKHIHTLISDSLHLLKPHLISLSYCDKRRMVLSGQTSCYLYIQGEE